MSISAPLLDGPGCNIDTTFIIPIANTRVLVTLSVRLLKFEGRVWCYLPSPHQDKGYGWVGVEGQPDIAFKIEVTVGYIPPKYLHLITTFIETKLKAGFMKDFVLPNWKRIEMPWKTKQGVAEMTMATESGLGHSDPLLQPVPPKVRTTKAVTTSGGTTGGENTKEDVAGEFWNTLTNKNTGKEVELQDFRRRGSAPSDIRGASRTSPSGQIGIDSHIEAALSSIT